MSTLSAVSTLFICLKPPVASQVGGMAQPFDQYQRHLRQREFEQVRGRVDGGNDASGCNVSRPSSMGTLSVPTTTQYRTVVVLAL